MIDIDKLNSDVDMLGLVMLCLLCFTGLLLFAMFVCLGYAIGSMF